MHGRWLCCGFPFSFGRSAPTALGTFRTSPRHRASTGSRSWVRNASFKPSQLPDPLAIPDVGCMAGAWKFCQPIPGPCWRWRVGSGLTLFMHSHTSFGPSFCCTAHHITDMREALRPEVVLKLAHCCRSFQKNPKQLLYPYCDCCDGGRRVASTNKCYKKQILKHILVENICICVFFGH